MALFALALIWLISLVTYEPTDPVWFFTTGRAHPGAGKFRRARGRLPRRAVVSALRICVVPAAGVIAVIGWHYFWCQPPDAAYTKLLGVTLLFGCASSFLSLVFGSTDVAGKTFHAGGSVGTWLGAALADYLNRTGSIIVLLTLMILSVILSTQFSFGRLFERASAESRDLSARGLGWLPNLARAAAEGPAAPGGRREAHEK